MPLESDDPPTMKMGLAPVPAPLSRAPRYSRVHRGSIDPGYRAESRMHHRSPERRHPPSARTAYADSHACESIPRTHVPASSHPGHPAPAERPGRDRRSRPIPVARETIVFPGRTTPRSFRNEHSLQTPRSLACCSRKYVFHFRQYVASLHLAIASKKRKCPDENYLMKRCSAGRDERVRCLIERVRRVLRQAAVLCVPRASAGGREAVGAPVFAAHTVVYHEQTSRIVLGLDGAQAFVVTAPVGVLPGLIEVVAFRHVGTCVRYESAKLLSGTVDVASAFAGGGWIHRLTREAGIR